MRIINQDLIAAPAGPAFQSFYKAGALAAWVAALLFRRNMDAEWTMLRTAGILTNGPSAAPHTADGWFALLQQDPLPGLLLLNFFDLMNYALVGLIFLGVILALHKTRPAASLAAGAAALAGIAGYFASNRALSLLALSGDYAAASNEAQRAALLAAGQSALAVQQANSFAGTGLYPSFLLVTLAGLLISAAMFRSGIFSSTAAWMGILANAFGAGYYLLLVFAPALTFLPLSISAVFLLAWYLLLGRRLWALGSRKASSIRSVKSAAPIAS